MERMDVEDPGYYIEETELINKVNFPETRKASFKIPRRFQDDDDEATYVVEEEVEEEDDEEAEYGLALSPSEASKRYRRRRTKNKSYSEGPKKLALPQVQVRRVSDFSGKSQFWCGKMYNEVIGHDGLRYWQLAELSSEGPQEYLADGSLVEGPSHYKWRLGANGLPLPIFNNARIKVSRRTHKTKKTTSHISEPSAGTSATASSAATAHSRVGIHKHKHKHRHHAPSFDFFFDANGEILKVSGDKLAYHWHLFNNETMPVDWQDIHGDPTKLIFKHDGTIMDLKGIGQDFKWMYVHPDGTLLDPAYEDTSSVVVYPADGSIGMRLLTNNDGSLFISKFGKPVLIVEDELDIYGPGGNKILRFNEDDDFTDPDGNELKIGKSLFDANGKPIMFVESLEEHSMRLGVDVPEVRYSGFNVTLDKWGNIIAGNPITLDPNGPPVLLVKYICATDSKGKVMHMPNKPPFVEKSSYLPFWIIDPDGKLIVLHDKEGKLWDRHFNTYKPTGSGQEPNGDTYDYYIFSGNNRPCDKRSICFHPEVLDPEDDEAVILTEDEKAELAINRNLDVKKLKGIFNYHEEMFGKSDMALFQCFEFPKCLKDGSYRKYLKSLCLEMKGDSLAEKKILQNIASLHSQ